MEESGVKGAEPPPPGAESDTEPEQEPVKPSENTVQCESSAKEPEIVIVPEVDQEEGEQAASLPEDDIMSMIEAEQPPDYIQVELAHK